MVGISCDLISLLEYKINCIFKGRNHQAQTGTRAYLCQELLEDSGASMTGPFSVYGYDLSMLEAYHRALSQASASVTVSQDTSQSQDQPVPPPIHQLLNSSGIACDDISNAPKASSKCYLSKLPLEILHQILSYALPHTIHLGPPRSRRDSELDDKKWDTLWLRGSIAIIATCRRLYIEGRKMLYGDSTFLIDVHFDRIQFSHRWKSTKQQDQTRVLTPQRKYDFLSQFSVETRALMRRFVLRLWVLDGYKGMIYHNVSNEIVLLKGLRAQVEGFCRAVNEGEQLFTMLEGEYYKPEKKDFVGVVIAGAGRRPIRPVKMDGLKTDDWIMEPLQHLGKETVIRDEAMGFPGV